MDARLDIGHRNARQNIFSAWPNSRLLAVLFQLILILISAFVVAAGFAYHSVVTSTGLGFKTDFTTSFFEVVPLLTVLFYCGWFTVWALTVVIRRFVPMFSSVLKTGSVSAADEVVDTTEIISNRSALSRAELLELDRFTVVNDINVRVEALRNRTRTILAAMAMSLIAAAIVVLFAGRLTSLDASAVSNVDRINIDLAASKRRLTKLYQIQSLFEQSDTNKLSNASKEAVDRLDREIGFLTRDDDTPKNLSSAKLMVDLEKDENARVKALLYQAWDKELAAEKGYNDWKYISATAITRVGVVLIIVYLVQILMGFYRYNSRLIAYYNSRRDLLLLWDGKQRGIKVLEDVLAPSKIDFGKEPRHPLEDVIKLAGRKLVSTLPGKGKGVAG